MLNLMNSNKTKNIYRPNDFSKVATAVDDPSLVYLTVECPHCEYENVISRGFINEKMLCSSSLCRRIIIVENFRDINLQQNSDKKEIA